MSLSSCVASLSRRQACRRTSLCVSALRCCARRPVQSVRGYTNFNTRWIADIYHGDSPSWLRHQSNSKRGGWFAATMAATAAVGLSASSDDEAEEDLSLPIPRGQICSSAETMAITIDKTLRGWHNVPVMKAHREAISYIRQLFESSYYECDNWSTCSNGFENWPEPNQFYDRTRRGLVLQVSYTTFGPTIEKLWTPFGGVEIIGGGSLTTRVHLTRQLLYQLSTIGSVTRIDTKQLGYRRMSLVGGKTLIHCDCAIPTETWTGAGDEVQFYLIRFNDSYPFAAAVNVDVEEVDLFARVTEPTELYVKDDVMFSKVTNGKNRF